MPQVSCTRCSKMLEYSGGDRPSFCAYCGQSLATTPPDETTALSISPTIRSGPSSPPVRGLDTIDFVHSSAPRAEVPEQVKGYRLIRELGRGGMGTVYEAEDMRIGRKVAIKIIAPGYVESKSAVDRFRQEGRLASSISHPRCVFVLEADEDDDGRPFIAMELMTGDTLQDLVEKGGALAVSDAVAKLLDVVDGLREAHRLGLIHRDVKPSNCFLDGDGRVKVGDFGLSKMEISSANLTRTGAFLGTPLYASPEQIKVDTLDGRTDVYSAAATLFFLLTGRAPFDRGDASATMARIVTDPAPSARQVRPEVPQGLDRVIRKGLERDRDRRYRDLDSFRAALLPFLPGHVPAARLSLRIGAYLFDYFLLIAILTPINNIPAPAWVFFGVDFLLILAYFALGDGIWGGSPGKRLLRLRVAVAGSRESAGIRRAALRAIVFLVLAEVPLDLLSFVESPWNLRPISFAIACVMAEILGLAAIAWPMRGRSDGCGLHDLASGTWVVSLPRDEKRLTAGTRRAIGKDRGSVSRPIGVMTSVGPYKVRGAVRWEANRRVVSGEDSTLGREAWIVIRPRGSAPPESARREVARATRPRWLAGGEEKAGRWDAFVAPAGCPLADLAGPEGLPWHDARPILEDLADEMAVSCAEGTLPTGLTVDQVWVQPDGRAILVDPLASAEVATAPEGPSDDERALWLLRRVASLALEGGRRHVDDAPDMIRSPVPVHASALLDRLLGGSDAHATVASFRADLEATRHHPTEVAIGQRATHLGILGLFLTPGLLFGYGATYLLLAGKFEDGLTEVAADLKVTVVVVRIWVGVLCASLFPMIWILWDLITRGGFAMKLAGLGLVRWDGRKVSRRRSAWRSLLVWLPPTFLLITSVWVRGRITSPGWPYWVPFGMAVALLPISVSLALIFPSKSSNERLSGLRVVPR